MSLPGESAAGMAGGALQTARGVLRLEAEAILALCDRLDESFPRALDVLYACQGRVVVSGMGKSGLIGRKIAATLASTGTPAFFLHPAEGSHGDLGMVVRSDVFMALSNSGETAEVLHLLPVVKRLGVPVLALTGRRSSTLARYSDVVLECGVAREAGGFGLVPTASTTVALALGDALAVALLERRGFREEDFRVVHPGGAIGRRPLLRVGDLMRTGGALPQVAPHTPAPGVLEEMSGKGLGMTAVTEGAGRLVGVITDGDVRRFLLRGGQVSQALARDFMTPYPKRIERHALAAQAVQRMECAKITVLFIVDETGVLEGVIHLHDLLQALVV